MLSFAVEDTAGVHHSTAELGGYRGAVFAFVANQCPVSNSYAPELARLYRQYASRGIAFFAVHSDPAESVDAIRGHAREFGFAFPVLLDRDQSLARAAGATSTLEVVVAARDGRVLYRGRLDDRYIEVGTPRSTVTRQDLRIALDEILAGKPVSVPETKAFGCAIPFEPVRSGVAVTFNRDVAPILYSRCASCHRPGEVGPFPLLTYTDAASRAGLIAHVVERRFMPPWLPEPNVRFEGERRLSQDEIDTLRHWSQAGAPEGGPSALPPSPTFPAGSQLGKPDLELSLPQPFQVPADGPDLYECFVIPLHLAQTRYVKAIEFRPGNRRVVHHALFFQDTTGTARQRGPHYSCFGSPGFLPARGLGGWTPGGFPIVEPEGIPALLHGGADLVLQVHYHPTGKPETDRPSIAFHFTSQPPQRQLFDVPLGSTLIDIPPGERNYRVTDHFTLPVDVDAIGIIPHAHYICREMRGTAVLPDGESRPLLWIGNWDFNWQEQYRYREPLRLPAGTRVEMEFTYDNSDSNPRNPARPARRVTWGLGSADEMAGLHLQVVPVNKSDAGELGLALWGKLMRSIGGGFYRKP